MDIAIDFDGTVVTHEYPAVGRELPFCVDILKEMCKRGNNLILNTMRSDATLEDAVKWFNDRDIPLYGVNCHPSQRIWTNSPKVYAELYIDDAAVGTPLKFDSPSGRKCVNWKELREILRNNYNLID